MPFKQICSMYLCLVCLGLVWTPAGSASYAIYIGKNLTKDGSVLIGGSGDEVSSHWLEVVAGATHARSVFKNPPGASNLSLPDHELF
ncbi:hypothetical protein N9I05_00275 [Pseudomonadales bacterium]|nr:hypothetical protein [Pseudomonadales bacterium]